MKISHKNIRENNWTLIKSLNKKQSKVDRLRDKEKENAFRDQEK